MEKIEFYTQKAIELLMEYGPRVLLAILTLLIGWQVIGVVSRNINKWFERSSLDVSLRGFLGSLLNWILKMVLIISVASMVGIETTSFVAVLGAASLAIGLALQGALSNFAGGTMILIFKPFKVGDLVEAQGYLGHVEEIQIFITKLVTFDNKTIIVPNGPLSNGSITNYSEKGKIRVDLVVGISYDSDIKKAKEVVETLMKNDPQVLQDPAPAVTVLELADSSVNLAVRPWCDPADYWDVYFNTLENAKLALDENAITIPFPQRDVHLYKHEV